MIDIEEVKTAVKLIVRLLDAEKEKAERDILQTCLAAIEQLQAENAELRAKAEAGFTRIGYTNEHQLSYAEIAVYTDSEQCPIPVFIPAPSKSEFDRMVAPLVKACVKEGPGDVLGAVDALRKLIFAAETSGGTAGRDEYLCKAIADAKAALPTPPAQGEE